MRAQGGRSLIPKREIPHSQLREQHRADHGKSPFSSIFLSNPLLPPYSLSCSTSPSSFPLHSHTTFSFCSGLPPLPQLTHIIPCARQQNLLLSPPFTPLFSHIFPVFPVTFSCCCCSPRRAQGISQGWGKFSDKNPSQAAKVREGERQRNTNKQFPTKPAAAKVRWSIFPAERAKCFYSL